MRKHHIMDHTGHSTVEFDPANTVDLDAAMARFNELTAQGFAAATRKAGASDYRVVKDFQNTEDETLFVPHMVGG